jgi:L-alanine-DL-glutamate epimerase-like enolase superfamily enzyme
MDGMPATRADVPVERVDVSAWRFPVDPPESDGTLRWDATTVVVEVAAGGRSGLGYSYTDVAAADVVSGLLAPVVRGQDPLDVGAAWAGIPRVKLKVGRDPGLDRHRLDVARDAVGPDTELFVDANGAYTRAEALRWAHIYAERDVRWFEEPVTSDDLDGLRLVRDRAPGGLAVAAGEYGWDLPSFRRMLEAGAVDCLQADVTRCGGYTGFLRVAALCDAHATDVSAHCAPQASVHACGAVWHLRHLEYFADHVRIEQALFDGCLEPEPDGTLVPTAHARGTACRCAGPTSSSGGSAEGGETGMTQVPRWWPGRGSPPTRP